MNKLIQDASKQLQGSWEQPTSVFINTNQANKLHFIQIINYYETVTKNKMYL